MRQIAFWAALMCAVAPHLSFALGIEPDAVLIRVIDTGPGLATVTYMPGGHTMIYDAGHWQSISMTMEAIGELVPERGGVDLLVLSHTDSDHIGAAEQITEQYHIHNILWPGRPRDSQTWKRADAAIKREVAADGARELNLRTNPIPPGTTWSYGDVWITFVAGYSDPPSEWGLTEESELNNAGSIIIRLTYRGRSVLFTGDAVGRHIGDPPHALIAMEREIVERAVTVPIDSDVLIAPHHGADNGSSTGFISAVSPDYVIFTAGHQYRHPRASAAKRYLDLGVPPERMLRTDLGDDEGSDEWEYGRIPGHTDRRGDDHIDILIRADGELVVEYSRTGHLHEVNSAD